MLLAGGSEPEVVEAERPVVTGGGPVVSREEAGALVWARLGAMDESWARAGALPAMSQWWAETVREWMLGGKAGAVVRAGRRGGKSTTGCKVAVIETIAAPHVVPRADLGMFGIVSALRADALERIRTCGVLLQASGYTETRWKDGGVKRGDFVTRLGGNPEVYVGTEFGTRVIRVMTASVAGVSGPTCIGLLGDEVAKWRDEDTGVNPAKEVIASVRPTMATQPLARQMWISSPWSTLDAHHAMFEAGNTPGQMVAYAPTWVSNPTLAACPVCGCVAGKSCEHDMSAERQAAGEAATRLLEPDESIWEREYKAIPMSAASSVFFDPVAVDAAMREVQNVG